MRESSWTNFRQQAPRRGDIISITSVSVELDQVFVKDAFVVEVPSLVCHLYVRGRLADLGIGQEDVEVVLVGLEV